MEGKVNLSTFRETCLMGKSLIQGVRRDRRRQGSGEHDGANFRGEVSFWQFHDRSGLITYSGADAIVLMDLKQDEAEEAAKDLVEWFGVSTRLHCETPEARLTRLIVAHGEAKPGEIKAVGVGCDVADEESVKAAFAKIKAEFGRVDVSFRSASHFVQSEHVADNDCPDLRDRSRYRRELHCARIPDAEDPEADRHQYHGHLALRS